MPHLTLEYSANLDHSPVDFNALCQTLAQCLIKQQDNGQPIYPIGGVRVRAYAAEHYCIANGLTDAGFVHGTLKIGSGRSEATKKLTGDALFDVMKTHFSALYAQTGLA